MPEIKIHDVMRTRRSAKARLRTIRRVELSDEYGGYYPDDRYNSPLLACGEVFEPQIQEIENMYKQMLTRIDNAKVIL